MRTSGLTSSLCCRYKCDGERAARHMKLFTLLSFCVLILWPSHEAWSQKSLPTVRIGIEAVAGTNSHYYVTKQLGLFQKHGLNLELISFPGGTVGLQSLLARSEERRVGKECRSRWS